MTIYMPQRQPWLRANLNVDLSNLFRKPENLQEKWYQAAMKELETKERAEQRGVQEEVGDQGYPFPGSPEGGMLRRDLTLEEQQALREKHRARLEALGVRYGQKADPWTMIPKYGMQEDPLERLEKEQKIRAKYRARKSAQFFVDQQGNYFDANTPEGKAGIKWSGKKGYRPQRVPSDQELAATKQLYGDRFLMPEERARAVEQKIEERIFTPEERKERTLDSYRKDLEMYSFGSSQETAIIERAMRDMKSLRVKNWDKLTKAERAALGALTKKYLRKLLEAGKKTKTKKKSSDYWSD